MSVLHHECVNLVRQRSPTTHHKYTALSVAKFCLRPFWLQARKLGMTMASFCRRRAGVSPDRFCRCKGPAVRARRLLGAAVLANKTTAAQRQALRLCRSLGEAATLGPSSAWSGVMVVHETSAIGWVISNVIIVVSFRSPVFALTRCAGWLVF